MTPDAADEAAFLALARELSARTGMTLEAYKPKCLRRRIATRMRACGVHTYDDYRRVLAGSPGELQRLHDALTINVTRFHRNPEAWTALAAKVIAPLVAGEGPVRAWSAGCSGGEEAYTVAMLWAAACAEARRGGRLAALEVDATDIDRASLDRAREARYAPEAFVETPAALVAQWTAAEAGARRVDERLRALVHVARLDLMNDPIPVARYDLICCRNVVIYFDRAMQERLFAAFADALRPGGYLFLGKVETLVGAARDRLELLDVRERIYRRPA